MPAKEGQFFILVSQKSGHTLGAEGGNKAPGTRVVTQQRNDADQNQHWYEDNSTGTLRHRTSLLCAHHDGGSNTIVLKVPQAGVASQQWTVTDTKVHHRTAPNQVFDIAEGNPGVGARLCAWNFEGTKHQLWDVVYVKPRYFFLKSEMHGKVLDVEAGNPAAGTPLLMWDQKLGGENSNQLWYFDCFDLLRSKLNNFAPDNTGPNGRLVLQPVDLNNPNRLWILKDGNRIAKAADPNILVDISGENKSNGAQVIGYKEHNGANQKWKIEYVQ